MSNTVFRPVREYPYAYSKNTYDFEGTPDEVKERISNALDNAPCQYRYCDTESQFYFHFYTPEKTEGCINCFTVSEGVHKVEFQRLDGSQIHFYTELYKCLHTLGLREAIPNPPCPEVCGLLHMPIEETLRSFTLLSSPLECERLYAVKHIYDTVVQVPGVMPKIAIYNVFYVLLRALDGCDSTELYRYTALVLKTLYGDDAFCEAVDLYGTFRSEHIQKTCAHFENLTFGDVLSRQEINRIINEIKEV